jgi:tetratricopeptide (TPR) repeat protein
MKRLACMLLATSLAAPVARAAGTPDVRYPNPEALRHYLAGRWLEQVGDAAGAGAEYSRALTYDPGSIEILLHAAEVAARAGDASRSLELAKQAGKRAPSEPRALWLEGAALFSLSRAEEALGPLRRATAGDPGNAEILRTLAHVAESLDSLAVVDTCYDRLVALDPSDGEAWFQLAAARARLGRYAEADTALTVALEENPARPGALFVRGWVSEHLGRSDEAVAAYRHHLEVHPDDTATRRRLVTLLAHSGHEREAIDDAIRVARDQKDDPSALAVLADLQFRSGRAGDARRTLAQMQAMGPADPDLAARSAEVLLRNDRDRDAVRAVDEWVGAHPGAGNGLRLRGWVRAAAGWPDSAATFAQLEVAGAPDSLPPRRVLARYLREAHRWSDARREIDWMLQREPDDAGLHMDLGFCRDMLGDEAGAIEAGRRALALAPDSPQVMNFLGYLLADHNRDLQEAEGLVRRAVAQDPDNGAYLDSMGWVLYRLGRLDEARARLEQAVKLTGGDPVVHEHLGDVYRDLKLLELARAQYRMSLAVDGSNRRLHNKLDAIH